MFPAAQEERVWGEIPLYFIHSLCGKAEFPRRRCVAAEARRPTGLTVQYVIAEQLTRRRTVRRETGN